jgi:hypothetical protein
VANVRINMHQGEIHTFLHDPSGPVHRAVASKVRKTEAIATATAPVRKASGGGRLKNNRESGVRDEGSRLVGFVTFKVHYALYVHEGTGIYGPRGAPIKPKTKKLLRFELPDGTIVYAKSVKGMPGRPFLVEALVIGAAPWPVTKHPLS